ILRMNKYEAIAQRIHLQYHLQGLTAQETATYIRHQMKQAGVTTPVFTDSAIGLIHSETKGIPRLINTICTHALYEAKRTGSEVIEDAHIGRILADTERQRGTAM
ncbi:MAG: ABC transporter, partial [Peptococcaceae bacterium BRH_c23]